MIQKSISESELREMELFYNPKCLIESTYTLNQLDWLNPETKCIKVRLYQIPMLSYDTVLVEDYKLTPQQNFERRVRVGTVLLISARNIGKTFISLVGNILKALVSYSGLEMTISSYDEMHVDRVCNEVRDFLTNHPFYKIYKKAIRAGSDYTMETLNCNKVFGVNEAIKSSDPGKAWWGKHASINFQDEIQAETEKAYLKKIDAIHEFGCIEILCGIPLITKTSPMGRWIKDRSKRNSILRIPQYVNPSFNETKKLEAIKKYGGEQSVGFRTNVEAEDIEGAQGAFDIGRVRANYTDRIIKSFEINKKIFEDYKRILVLEPIKNATKTFVFADIGDTAASEVGIIGLVNGKYKLIYNITYYRLEVKEQIELLEWIFNRVKADYCSVDCTIMGKPIFEGLSDLLNIKETDLKGSVTNIIQRVFWCAFNEDICVGFEKDEKTGYVKLNDKNEPVKKFENTLIFAVQRLRELFFDVKFDIPESDFKLDDEFSSYIMTIVGNGIKFGSTSSDHYVQAFQVFAILQWLTEQLPKISQEYSSDTNISLGIFGLK
jgi:hypothetical protein